MIKIIVKEGKISEINCECGNKTDFSKYQSSRIVVGERNRKIRVPNTGIACDKKMCKEILTEEELNMQLRDQRILQNVPDEKEKATGQIES